MRELGLPPTPDKANLGPISPRDPNLDLVIALCRDTQRPVKDRLDEARAMTTSKPGAKYWAMYFTVFARDLTLEERLAICDSLDLDELFGCRAAIAVYSPNIDVETRRKIALTSRENPLSAIGKIDRGISPGNGEFVI